MSTVGYGRRPARHAAIVLAVLLLHAALLYVLLQWHPYTPARIEHLIRVSIFPAGKPHIVQQPP